MTFLSRKPILILGFLLAFTPGAYGQELRRDLNFSSGSPIQIVNKSGRVSVKTAEKGYSLIAVSPKGVSDSEVKVAGDVVTVSSTSSGKRIDLFLVVPERATVRVETAEGAIDVSGNFSQIQAKTDTGTLAIDVPVGDLKYRLEWTESRPRFLADIELEKVKELSAGRFQIKGHHRKEVNTQPAKSLAGTVEELPKRSVPPKIEPVSLELSTARGIILLNVPPGEVNSDLRERPLTNAAKAIVRSGDSLLMEAIRRASPKYFGDYARTLPPIRTEPGFAARSPRTAGPNAEVKTALVRVTDLKNRAISGLSKEDFEVTENGALREIVSIEKSEAPFNLVLLLDVSGSVENYVNFIRKAARSFVNTVGTEDKVAIVIFNEDVKQLSTFTTDKGKLSASLDTFDAGGGTAYYDALAFSIADTLRPLKGERTAIVVLTDGDDNRSFLAFDSLSGSIQESGALIYPLYVPSGLIALAAQNINADIDPLRKKYMSLSAKSEGEGEKLAKISGGVYYSITQIGQLQKAYEDIVLQMRAAYNVKFRSTPEPTGNGASPKLKIRVKKENAFTTVTNVTAN
jgi:VWFA-related protein